MESAGVPRKNIIDGRAFGMRGFNLQKLLTEGVACGIFNRYAFPENFHSRFCIYPRIFKTPDGESVIKIGSKSGMGNGSFFDGHNGILTIGNFSTIGWRQTYEFFNDSYYPDRGHHTEYLGVYIVHTFDWAVPPDMLPPAPEEKKPKIEIGSDVWVGRGCIFKTMHPEKPLTIGDGAVIASDSVVVKNVPPYAIVGGNPAQFIKWRFPEKIIEALLRIKWWNWDLDKIYENFKYYNRVEEFVARHDN